MSTDNFDRFDLATEGDNVREDLTDVIYNISPTEVPFQANSGRGNADQTLHEWQIDELDVVDTANAAIDGADFGADNSDPAQRIGNFAQISIKYIAVSRRANIVNKAGRRSELAYQIAKRGKELRRDVEAISTQNQAALAGNSTTASLTGSLGAWIRTTTDRGAGGTDPALSGGTFGQPTTAAGDGTVRALSEGGILALLRDAYIEGGNPNMMMCGPTVKQRFSNYMFTANARIATQRQDQGPVNRGGISVVGAVDVYVSDFTVIDVVPNRFQRERDFWILDSEYWEFCYLDGYKTETISKIGDAERRHILVDWCLASHQEAASAVFADVDETTAMVL